MPAIGYNEIEGMSIVGAGKALVSRNLTDATYVVTRHKGRAAIGASLSQSPKENVMHMSRSQGADWRFVATYCFSGLLTAWLVVGCAGPSGSVSAADLPLLPAGFHLGEMTTFSTPTQGNSSAIESARAELLAAGMRVGRAQVGWADLEPMPGVFDESELLDRLASLKEEGLMIFLTLETIDSEGFVLPDDLQDDPLTLSNGMAFDDARMTDRFAALLDWVVPMLVAYGGYAIAVGNEPDNTIRDQPDLAAPVARFLGTARRHAHTIETRMAVTMTLTDAALAADATFAAPIVAASDVLSMNYYCQRLPDFSLRSAATVLTDLDEMVALADGRQILLQELGCSAGVPGSNSELDGSEAAQVEFIERVTGAMRERDAFRAAYWFTLVDWPLELAEPLSQPLCEEGLSIPCAAFRDAMLSYGLLMWEDGARRPSFDAFRDAI